MSRPLLEYCELADVTVASVARDADLDPKWLYKVAKGERGFSPETAAAIEAATNGVVTANDLTKVRMAWLEANGGKRRKQSREAGKKASKRPFAQSKAESEAA